MNGGRGCGWGSDRGGGWWQKVKAAVNRKWGEWFFPRLERRIGDGRGTKFWLDEWGGAPTLKSRFPRLFHLSANETGNIGDMGVWLGEEWRWELTWRRPPSGRDLDELQQLTEWLGSVPIRKDIPDGWSWGDSGSGVYTVKEAYEAIARRQSGEGVVQDMTCGHFGPLWKSVAPFKQKVIGWRILRDRLPTRDNLIRRNIIPSAAGVCTCCHEAPETLEHLLLRCDPVEHLWGAMVRWVGFRWAAPKEIGTHFLCFLNSCKGKRMRKVLGAMWVCVVWILWRWRNAAIFENQLWDFVKIEAEIKSRLWAWLIAGNLVPANGRFVEWSNGPLVDRLISL